MIFPARNRNNFFILRAHLKVGTFDAHCFKAKLEQAHYDTYHLKSYDVPSIFNVSNWTDMSESFLTLRKSLPHNTPTNCIEYSRHNDNINAKSSLKSGHFVSNI